MSRCVSLVSFVGERQVSINPKKTNSNTFLLFVLQRSHVILLFVLDVPNRRTSYDFQNLSLVLPAPKQMAIFFLSFGYNTSKKSKHDPSFLVGYGCLSWVGRLLCLVWLCDRDLFNEVPVLQYIGSFVCVGRLMI